MCIRDSLFAATPQRDLEHDELIETLAQLYALGQYLDKLEPTSDGTRASIAVFPSTEPGTNSFLTSRWNMSDFRTATRANWNNLRAAFFDSVDEYLTDPHTGSVVSATSQPRTRTSRSARLPPRSDHSHGSNSLASSASHNRTVRSNTSDLSSLQTHRSQRSSRSRRSHRSHASSALSSRSSLPDQTLTSRQKASLRLVAKLNPSKGGSTSTIQKDEKRVVLPARVTFDGAFDKFEVFRHKIQGHFSQTGAAYLFARPFQKAFLKDGTACYINFLEDVHSESQVVKDVKVLYGTLLSACS